MHMADALISPSVGGVMWAASGYLAFTCARKVASDGKDRTALMGVLAAFVFAAQMINFSIPGTGSSGHIGGGLLLAIFLGPERAFLSMVSILTVQALFFADGGLLALGCNIFNLGFFPCFIAYPLIYKKITAKFHGTRGVFWGSVLSVIVALELGAFFVTTETIISNITQMPADMFLLFMLPVHLAIGAVEGLATALVVAYVYNNAPEVLNTEISSDMGGKTKKVVAAFMVLALLVGGIFAWYASSHPDGLEWAVANVIGVEEIEAPDAPVYTFMSALQEKIAFLPDYGLPGTEDGGGKIGTSVSGVVGSFIALAISAGFGFLLRNRRRAH